MPARFIAVTQLELADPERPQQRLSPPRLSSLILLEGQPTQRLDMAYPQSGVDADRGTFATSVLEACDHDGRQALIYAVTPAQGPCYLLRYAYDHNGWRVEPLGHVPDYVTIVRSIAVGDVDHDGRAEIVLGTRPNGAVISMRPEPGQVGRADVVLIDRDQYGVGTTNTREVAVADVDGDGRMEILVATARADEQKWEPTPGAILLYAYRDGAWHKRIIDDHDGDTHSRMVAVAPIKHEGVPQAISCTVGTLSVGGETVTSEPQLRLYTIGESTATCEVIETLTDMIKSRSFACGDVDGDGRPELAVGTRAVEVQGRGLTALYLYRYLADDARWQRETLDTTGPLGFHCVAIGDVDGDGFDEVVASDDSRGQIKIYKHTAAGWRITVLHDAGVEIFCAALHIGVLPDV